MTAPKATMPMVVPNRVQSVLSFCAILMSWLQLWLQLCDEAFENLAAMFVAVELIETGAGRGQQDGIARAGARISEAHRVLKRAGVLKRDRALQLFANLLGGRANQQGGVRFGGKGRAKHGIVQAFVLAAQDHPKSAGEGVQSFQGGVHTGGFRVVIEIDSMQIADEFQAVLDRFKRAHGGGDGGKRRSSQAGSGGG